MNPGKIVVIRNPPSEPRPEILNMDPLALQPPKKLGAKTGGGDLAAMMAARKKAMDENDDDGYYF